MKIGKRLRDLLLRQIETYAISSTRADYMGETYTYPAVTRKEILGIIDRIRTNLHIKKK